MFAKMNITEEQKKILLQCIAKKMAPTAVKIRADFELTCFTYEGIEAIKATLQHAKKVINDEQFTLEFKIIAPPVYKCECLTYEKPRGIQKIEEALKVLEETILQKRGSFKLVMKPQVIGAQDEKDIKDIQERFD
jgi:translation initiation factor 2 subunit 1